MWVKNSPSSFLIFIRYFVIERSLHRSKSVIPYTNRPVSTKISSQRRTLKVRSRPGRRHAMAWRN
jgi:hypothetical protein